MLNGRVKEGQGGRLKSLLHTLGRDVMEYSTGSVSDLVKVFIAKRADSDGQVHLLQYLKVRGELGPSTAGSAKDTRRRTIQTAIQTVQQQVEMNRKSAAGAAETVQ